MSTKTASQEGPSPFHAGELALQERAGVKERMDMFGRRVIRRFMPNQHRRFYEQLPLIVAGSVDAEKRVWASLLFGAPGFISAPDERTLSLSAKPIPGDPLAQSLRAGRKLGLLGLDFTSRRRNRVNTHVRSVDDSGIQLGVDQAFGNCPQYIQTRTHTFVRGAAQPGGTAAEQITDLSSRDRALIENADTLFVASYQDSDGENARGGADVSHRGGRPGFVKVEGNRLTVPDFSGNNHFNTLGNFVLNPKAGLLFVDFASGDILMLSGTVEILHDGPEVSSFPGAERAWRFDLEVGVRLTDALPIRWTFDEYSPSSLRAGTWAEAGGA